MVNKENLKLLVEKLKTVEEKEFNMETWESECNTTACVGGWIAHFFPDYIVEEVISVTDYEQTIHNFSNINNADNTELFDWIFNGFWTELDNSVRGAIARINYVLNNDLLPKWFLNIHDRLDVFCKDFDVIEQYKSTIKKYYND